MLFLCQKVNPLMYTLFVYFMTHLQEKQIYNHIKYFYTPLNCQGAYNTIISIQNQKTQSLWKKWNQY